MPDIIIPTPPQCLTIMKEAGMPLHIQLHSRMVAALSVTITVLLNKTGMDLNTEMVHAGALLHDIAKARSIDTGENHSECGAHMLEELGFPQLALIVREHVTMDLQRVNGPLTESLIVNYADKRVKHDEIVTIENRFHDLIDRYAMTEEQRARMIKRLKLYQRLERKIFDRLSIKPTGPEIMGLPSIEGGEYENS
jgi:putative nucleotidyltransferase with HDIG domain